MCGAPALTGRVVQPGGAGRAVGARPVVAVLGAAGKSGSLSAAAARRAGAGRVIGVVPGEAEAATLRAVGLADEVVIADARGPGGARGGGAAGRRPGRGDRGLRGRARAARAARCWPPPTAAR